MNYTFQESIAALQLLSAKYHAATPENPITGDDLQNFGLHMANLATLQRVAGLDNLQLDTIQASDILALKAAEAAGLVKNEAQDALLQQNLTVDSMQTARLVVLENAFRRSVNVFPVLRASQASGRYGTLEYAAQLERAASGYGAYPSIYAARDAAFDWLQTQPAGTQATISVQSGHTEKVCHTNTPLVDADRVFSGDTLGVFHKTITQAIIQPSTIVDTGVTDGQIDSNNLEPTQFQLNPNSSSLVGENMLFVCEKGVELTFSGLPFYASSTPALADFDVLHLIPNAPRGLLAYGNGKFVLNIRHLKVSNPKDYAGSPYPILYICRDGDTLVNVGTVDCLAKCAFLGAVQTLKSFDTKTARQKIVFSVGSIIAKDDAYFTGVYIFRAVKADIELRYNTNYAVRFGFATQIGYSGANMRGALVKDTNITVSGNVKGKIVGEGIMNHGFVHTYPRDWHTGNTLTLDGDFEIENGLAVWQPTLATQIKGRLKSKNTGSNIGYQNIVAVTGGKLQGENLNGQLDVTNTETVLKDSVVEILAPVTKNSILRNCNVKQLAAGQPIFNVATGATVVLENCHLLHSDRVTPLSTGAGKIVAKKSTSNVAIGTAVLRGNLSVSKWYDETFEQSDIAWKSVTESAILPNPDGFRFVVKTDENTPILSGTTMYVNGSGKLQSSSENGFIKIENCQAVSGVTDVVVTQESGAKLEYALIPNDYILGN